jgi:hypothetical protein
MGFIHGSVQPLKETRRELTCFARVAQANFVRTIDCSAPAARCIASGGALTFRLLWRRRSG